MPSMSSYKCIFFFANEIGKELPVVIGSFMVDIVSRRASSYSILVLKFSETSFMTLKNNHL